MKNSLLILLFFLTSCSRAPLQVRNPLMYRATKEGKVLKLIGTAHFSSDVLMPPKVVGKLIEGSQSLYVEFDETKTNDFKESIREEVRTYAPSLKDEYPDLLGQLSEKARDNLTYTLEHQKTKNYLKKYNYTYTLENISPMAVNLLIEDLIKEKKVFEVLRKTHQRNLYFRWTKSGAFGEEQKGAILDNYIEAKARSYGLPIYSLDNRRLIDPAMNLDLKGPDKINDYIVQLIEQFFGDGKDVIEYYQGTNDILELYAKGDYQGITKYFLELEEEHQKKLLYDRNKAWAKKLDEDPVYNATVAVGVMHLLGKKSLLDYLKERGFRVTIFHP